jgi:CubicO group peptidase (beta-lactamase class C family)
MKKIISLILILLMIVVSSITPAFAVESQEISHELHNMVQDIINKGKSKGAVLSVVKDGEIQLCKGYGFADEYLGYDADGEKTAFRIGSVSKTFVAVAAQKLSQEGRLNMNSDISNYLESDFPKLSYPVTMHQLLTHTAGFEDMVTGMAVYNVSDTEELAVNVRKYMPKQIYKPGEVISYSNYGIALAAYVIESITNQNFAEYCEEQIFKPLDMNRTTFRFMHDIVYVSKAYLPNGNETLEPYMNLYPEGSAVSTAEDMSKYMLWLLNTDDTRILSAESKEELFKKQFSMSDEFEGIGYIWNRKSRNDKIFYDKKGETLNFYTRIAVYPQENTGVFLSFNTFVPEHEINEIMNKSTDLLYGEKQEYNLSSGNLTLDIDGLYVSNWSSFKTPEKILRHLIPGKMLSVNKVLNNYYINGEKITLIGENLYSSEMGLLKFQKINNKIIMSTESAITYVKVPILLHSIVQLIIPVLFIVMTFVVLIREVLLKIKNKSKRYNYTLLLNSFIQIIAFVTLCLLMYKGIAVFALLKYAPYMKFCGWLILLIIVLNIVFMRKSGRLKELSLIVWNLLGVVFVGWMVLFNII